MVSSTISKPLWLSFSLITCFFLIHPAGAQDRAEEKLEGEVEMEGCGEGDLGCLARRVDLLNENLDAVLLSLEVRVLKQTKLPRAE